MLAPYHLNSAKNCPAGRRGFLFVGLGKVVQWSRAVCYASYLAMHVIHELWYHLDRGYLLVLVSSLRRSAKGHGAVLGTMLSSALSKHGQTGHPYRGLSVSVRTALGF